MCLEPAGAGTNCAGIDVGSHGVYWDSTVRDCWATRIRPCVVKAET